MKLKLLFPCDYFDKSAPDEAYKEEYAIAKSIGFDIVLFNYDEFLEEGKTKIEENPDNVGIEEHFHTLCHILYRGWMMDVRNYSRLENLMEDNGYELVNSSFSYEATHHFDMAYCNLEHKIDTPNMIELRFNMDKKWEWHDSALGWMPLLDIKNHFTDYFIMKDNVKSVKGTDFPDKISVDIGEKEFNELIDKFKELRGDLYTGSIILKQYVPLKRYADSTNEWRVFYFLDRPLTISVNSNQPDNAPRVPDELINHKVLLSMESMFYTIDFAETEEGKWIVIETGDGQVSGLSPNQNILEFYTKIQNYWNERYNLLY
jgi:hypothetical protein